MELFPSCASPRPLSFSSMTWTFHRARKPSLGLGKVANGPHGIMIGQTRLLHRCNTWPHAQSHRWLHKSACSSEASFGTSSPAHMRLSYSGSRHGTACRARKPPIKSLPGSYIDTAGGDWLCAAAAKVAVARGCE